MRSRATEHQQVRNMAPGWFTTVATFPMARPPFWNTHTHTQIISHWKGFNKFKFAIIRFRGTSNGRFHSTPVMPRCPTLNQVGLLKGTGNNRWPPFFLLSVFVATESVGDKSIFVENFINRWKGWLNFAFFLMDYRDHYVQIQSQKKDY